MKVTVDPEAPAAIVPTDWLRALRRYVLFAVAAHLSWEVAQLPLYTIWLTATAGELAFAVLHCTGGDLLISLTAMMLALFLFGRAGWPSVRIRPVLAAAVTFGLGYTIFSEWLNIEVRQAWAYRDLMPVIPLIGTGLSPVLQWIAIPVAAYAWALRPARARDRADGGDHG